MYVFTDEPDIFSQLDEVKEKKTFMRSSYARHFLWKTNPEHAIYIFNLTCYLYTQKYISQIFFKSSEMILWLHSLSRNVYRIKRNWMLLWLSVLHREFLFPYHVYPARPPSLLFQDKNSILNHQHAPPLPFSRNRRCQFIMKRMITQPRTWLWSWKRTKKLELIACMYLHASF